MTSRQRSFTLDPETEAYLDRRVADGDDADAIVRAALSLLAEEDRAGDAILAQHDTEAIRKSIEESRADGVTWPAEEVFARLEAKYAAMARAQPDRAAE